MENYQKCKVKNCNNNIYKKSKEKKYCCKHYKQIRKYEKILERTQSDPNEIIDCGDYYEICLYNKKNEEVARTQIDKEDIEKVKGYKWGLHNKEYVKNQKNKILLHHLIFGNPPTGYMIDHRDTNPLNNRKYNLRFATHQQNQMNNKGKGYSWDENSKKWEPYIRINNKLIHLGYFTNEQDAIKARMEAELKYFGEFSYKNNNILDDSSTKVTN